MPNVIEQDFFNYFLNLFSSKDDYIECSNHPKSGHYYLISGHYGLIFGHF